MISPRLTVLVAVVLALITVAGYGLALWRDRRLRRASAPIVCPGPRPSRWARVRRWAPWAAFYRGLCGYDLASVRPGPDGSVICPECARRVRDRREARLHHGRVRWRNVLAAGMALVITAWCSRTVTTGAYIRWLPSDLLIWVRATIAPHIPLVDREVARRLYSSEFTPSQQAAVARSAIVDLRDDDIKWNADEAQAWLLHAGANAVPALETALGSDDRQQRDLAWDTLLAIPGYDASSLFTQVTLLQMSEDGRFGGLAMQHLVNNPRIVSDAELRRTITHGDPRQRLLASAVAGLSGRRLLFEDAAPVLLASLRSNTFDGDAKLASRSLAGFPSDLLVPALLPLADDPDHQTRTVARELLNAKHAPMPMFTIVDTARAVITDCGPRLADLSLDQLPAPRLRSAAAVVGEDAAEPSEEPSPRPGEAGGGASTNDAGSSSGKGR